MEEINLTPGINKDNRDNKDNKGNGVTRVIKETKDSGGSLEIKIKDNGDNLETKIKVDKETKDKEVNSKDSSWEVTEVPKIGILKVNDKKKTLRK